jgi:hypothetical protein
LGRSIEKLPCMQKKLDMLRQLGHIKGDESKLHHLNNLYVFSLFLLHVHAPTDTQILRATMESDYVASTDFTTSAPRMTKDF